jgi:hypothetical protein
MAHREIELTDISKVEAAAPVPGTSPGEDEVAELPSTRQEFSLPRVDGGKDAWLFLTASFFIEALVWGASI